MLLRIAFSLAPILFGLDKFAGVLIDDWTHYFAPEFDDLIPGSAAGRCTSSARRGARRPGRPRRSRFGGQLVAGWLAGIILSLLLVGGYADIALRDFGLLVGALCLSRLASAHAVRR